MREVMQRLLAEIKRIGASRIVFDSLSELRLLAQHPLHYRRKPILLKQFFEGRQCTVLFLDDGTAPEDVRQLQSIVHGVVLLEQNAVNYGKERRRLRVVKMRGLETRGGYHDLSIVRGGLRVFPRLVASEQPQEFEHSVLPSGFAELDTLLGGGIDRGTATLVIGPAGSGKSSLALRYALSAVERGEHVALFAFDERIQTLLMRARGLGLGLEKALEGGRLRIGYFDRSYDPANHRYGYTLASEREPGSLLFDTQPVTTKLSDPTRDNFWNSDTVNPSFPNTSFFIGDYSAIAARGDGVVALWTDLRRRVCFGQPINACGHGQDVFFASVR